MQHTGGVGGAQGSTETSVSQRGAFSLQRTATATATNCTTLNHTTTHCNTLQNSATHCTTQVAWEVRKTTEKLQCLEEGLFHCNTRNCKKLHHTAPHHNKL